MDTQELNNDRLSLDEGEAAILRAGFHLFTHKLLVNLEKNSVTLAEGIYEVDPDYAQNFGSTVVCLVSLLRKIQPCHEKEEDKKELEKLRQEAMRLFQVIEFEPDASQGQG